MVYEGGDRGGEEEEEKKILRNLSSQVLFTLNNVSIDLFFSSSLLFDILWIPKN